MLLKCHSISVINQGFENVWEEVASYFFFMQKKAFHGMLQTFFNVLALFSL